MASERYSKVFCAVGRGLDRASDKINPWANQKADNFERLGKGSNRFMQRVGCVGEYDNPALVTGRILGSAVALPFYLVFNISRGINQAAFSVLARLTGPRTSSVSSFSEEQRVEFRPYPAEEAELVDATERTQAEGRNLASAA